MFSVCFRRRLLTWPMSRCFQHHRKENRWLFWVRTETLASKITCGVLRGEVTSAACLIRGQHPDTGTGWTATVPAPLHEDKKKDKIIAALSHFSTSCDNQSDAAGRRIEALPSVEVLINCPSFLTWLDSLCSELMTDRSWTDRCLWGSHEAEDIQMNIREEKWWKPGTVSSGECGVYSCHQEANSHWRIDAVALFHWVHTGQKHLITGFYSWPFMPVRMSNNISSIPN